MLLKVGIYYLSGFFYRIIYPGLTYDYKENGISMVSLLPKLKATTVITTMNTPKIMYKLTYGNALKKALIKGTFKKSGMKKRELDQFKHGQNEQGRKKTKMVKEY